MMLNLTELFGGRVGVVFGLTQISLFVVFGLTQIPRISLIFLGVVNLIELLGGE